MTRNREKEIRQVATQLDDLLNELASAVDGLTVILTTPPPDPGPQA